MTHVWCRARPAMPNVDVVQLTGSISKAKTLLHFNMTTKGLEELSNAFMYIGKRRDAAEANNVFKRYKDEFPSQIPWPSAAQRPFVYVGMMTRLFGALFVVCTTRPTSFANVCM